MSDQEQVEERCAMLRTVLYPLGGTTNAESLTRFWTPASVVR